MAAQFYDNHCAANPDILFIDLFFLCVLKGYSTLREGIRVLCGERLVGSEGSFFNGQKTWNPPIMAALDCPASEHHGTAGIHADHDPQFATVRIDSSAGGAVVCAQRQLGSRPRDRAGA